MEEHFGNGCQVALKARLTPENSVQRGRDLQRKVCHKRGNERKEKLEEEQKLRETIK